MMYQVRTKLNTVVTVIIGIIAIAAIWGIVLYRTNTTITVTARYWRYDVSVQYQRVTMESRMQTTGSARVCTTSMMTALEPVTHTYTRCSGYRTGDNLPPVWPDVPCQMLVGDYTIVTLTYHVVDTRDRTFPPELWDWLEPGASRLVRVNVLGNITVGGKE